MTAQRPSMVALRVGLSATRPHTHVEAAVAAHAGLGPLAAICVVPEAAWLSVGPHRLHAHQLGWHTNVVVGLLPSIAFSSFLFASTTLLLATLVLQPVLQVGDPLKQPGRIGVVIIAATFGSRSGG